MAVFKGRKPSRTTATDLTAKGFRLLAMPETEWTVPELAELNQGLIDFYEDARVTGTYGNRE